MGVFRNNEWIRTAQASRAQDIILCTLEILFFTALVAAAIIFVIKLPGLLSR